MSAYVWESFASEWQLNAKVSFNGVARTITVNAGVTALDIQKDVWSRWIDWAALPGNDYHLLAMRKSGYDVVPGGRSGLIYFLINGWKLIYNPSNVRLTGVLYSDDYETPLWGYDGQPIYPAVVSSLVNTAVTVQNIVTGNAITAADVWNYLQRTLTSAPAPTATEVADAVWNKELP